jgi:hypothetical protein
MLHTRIGCGFAKKMFRFKVKRSETRSVSHAFCTLTRNFFAYDQSEVNTVYSHFVLLPKIFRFAPIFLFRLKEKWNKRFFALFRFKAKRNKRFSTPFHFTRYRFEKLKDQPWYFSSFLYRLSQNFTWSFFAFKFLASFCFVFASFQFCFVLDAKTSKKHFFRIEAKKISFPFLFISLWSENDLLLFHFVFASVHFRFASDFYVSHRCETSKKLFFSHRS